MSRQALAQVLAELTQPAVPAGARMLAEALCRRYGPALRAVLFYGSNLRRGDDREGLLDLYALVDGYRHAHHRALPAFANRLLPPNVYYLEHPRDGGPPLRAKVALVSAADFARGVAPRTFESYFWGRFAQPCALLHARDAAARGEVHAALAQAHLTALQKALPLLPPQGDLTRLWAGVIGACYRAELRPERPGTAVAIAAAGHAWYAAVTPPLAALLPALTLSGAGTRARYALSLPAWRRRLARASWALRRVHGRTRNLLRLLKAAVTFAGGVDYVLWKLERHTGVPVARTPLLARHPRIGIWPVAWRAYRRRRGGV